MWFVAILMVFIVAYAIASEAILYPETELSWKLLYHLPRKAYWQIYGELFLEEIEGQEIEVFFFFIAFSKFHFILLDIITLWPLKTDFSCLEGKKLFWT